MGTFAFDDQRGDRQEQGRPFSSPFFVPKEETYYGKMDPFYNDSSSLQPYHYDNTSMYDQHHHYYNTYQPQQHGQHWPPQWHYGQYGQPLQQPPLQQPPIYPWMQISRQTKPKAVKQTTESSSKRSRTTFSERQTFQLEMEFQVTQ